MANANTPFGLRPLAYSSGGPYNGAVQVYYVPSGNATALFLGDPLLVVTDSADANGVPTIGIAAAGGSDYITGAFMGVANSAGELVIPVTQSTPVYLPAGTAAYVYVADDPNLVFMLQEDSVGGALAAGAASRNANLVAGSGSTVTAMSGWMLELEYALATTATLQMRILRAYQSQDNAIGDYAKWLCRINLHSITDTTGV